MGSRSGIVITVDSNIPGFSKQVCEIVKASGLTLTRRQDGAYHAANVKEPIAWCDHECECSNFKTEKLTDDRSALVRTYHVFYDTPLSMCSRGAMDLLESVRSKTSSMEAFLYVDMSLENYSFDALIKNVRQLKSGSTVFINNSETRLLSSLRKRDFPKDITFGVDGFKSLAKHRKERIEALKGTRTILFEESNCSPAVIARVVGSMINSFIEFGYILSPPSLARISDHRGTVSADGRRSRSRPEPLPASCEPWRCDPHEFTRLGCTYRMHRPDVAGAILLEDSNPLYVVHDDSEMLFRLAK